MKHFTAREAAKELDIDISRIQRLCRAGRLGVAEPRHGNAWVITAAEIARYRAIGPKPAGRPRKKSN